MVASVAQGLSSAEAARRLAAFGPNAFARASRWQSLRRLAGELLDPMALMLAVASVLYFVAGERIDAVILAVALVPVLGVDVVLAARSRKALAALAAAVAPEARVVRDGMVRSIAAETIVPGDLLLVAEGEIVHADGVLEQAEHVLVDEAQLTGESEPLHRDTGDPVHAGSRVLAGRGRVRVRMTGPHTELGRIAGLVATAEAGAAPIQAAVGHLVRRLAIAAGVVAVVMFVLRLAAGSPPVAALLAAIGLAMAAVPEELPLVLTLFLSLGAARLGRARVLVRRLAAVEALGATTVICTDKTGTLTRGVFELADHRPLGGDEDRLLRAAVLACEPEPDDALDAATLAYAGRAGTTSAGWRLAGDYELEASGRHLTHVWTSGDAWSVAVKGALEGVLEHCVDDPAIIAAAHAEMQALAARGMRVLAVAERSGTGALPASRADAERGLRLAGLIGFRDPLRESAVAAVAACRRAGIAVKMITGDHAATARAIAELAGIEIGARGAITGDELAALPPEERCARIREVSVFARVRPEQKLEIVDALLAAGEVVAMTGDGVNDAPALRRASIGVAMGRGATEVARATADLVLLDSDLGALVSTIAEGRRIYANLQKSFLFLVGFHVPIIGLALAAPLCGLPQLLLPVHLVWLELVVHPVAALVFETEPAAPGDMTRAPRSPRAPLLPRRLLVRSVISGAIVTAAAFALYAALLGRGVDAARGAALCAVVLGGVAIAWAERALGTAWRQVARPRSARTWVILALAAATVPLAFAVPEIGRVLRVAFPGWDAVAVAIAAVVASVAWRIR